MRKFIERLKNGESLYEEFGIMRKIEWIKKKVVGVKITYSQNW